MTPWHSNCHHEDTLGTTNPISSQLRHTPARSPYAYQGSPQFSAHTHCYPNTYSTKTEAYRDPQFSTKAVADSCEHHTGKSATSNRREPLGRHRVQEGGIQNLSANDRALRWSNTEGLQANPKATTMGIGAYG
jgi:hypothetical protein